MSEAHQTCEELNGLISAYWDGEATPVERDLVDSHLATCAACRHLYHDLGETISLSAMLPELDPPLGLRAQILERTVYRRSPWDRLRESVRQPALWRPTLALATAGVAGLTLWSLHGQTSNFSGAKTPLSTHSSMVAAAPEAAPSPSLNQPGDTPALDTGKISHLIQRIHDRLVAPKTEAPVEIAANVSTPMKGEPRLATEPSTEISTHRMTVSTEISDTAPPKTPKVSALPKLGTRKSLGKSVPAGSLRMLHVASKKRLDIPEIPSEDSSAMPTATSPPMVPKESPMGLPAQSMPTKPDSHKEDEQLAEAPRPSQSLVEELRDLATLKKKPRNPMDAVVAELNASAPSPTRQVEWKFAKMKF